MYGGRYGVRVGPLPMNRAAGMSSSAMCVMTCPQSWRVVAPTEAFGPELVQQCSHVSRRRPALQLDRAGASQRRVRDLRGYRRRQQRLPVVGGR